MIYSLVKIDPAHNQRRFYALSVNPTLFGAWSVSRARGALVSLSPSWLDSTTHRRRRRPPLLHAQSAVVEHEMALMDRRHMGSAHAALPALPFPTSATLGSSSAPGSRGGGGFHESRSAR